jgi:hypothetical protein
MYAFAVFENFYEYIGDLSLPANNYSGVRAYNVKNFATESHLPNVGKEAH